MKANNMYNKTQVVVSDKGGKIKNQESKPANNTDAKTNHDARSPSPFKEKAYPNQEHKGFQLGTNPMQESSFEKELIIREKKDRDQARERYVAGIQGTDGGKKPYECYNINN